MAPSSLLLLACFFFSGAAGLLYELLWTRLLALSFGHTMWAMTTVLAVFMGGLALGSHLLGRAADRWNDPVRFYALLELLLGLTCLATPFLLGLSRAGYILLAPFLGEAFLPRALLQSLLCAPVLLLPTTLMGGTLPALVRVFGGGRDGAAGRGVALLYGVNTLGAAAGVFAAGYWLLPSAGVSTTNTLAAGINIAIGWGLLLFWKKGLPSPVALSSAAPPASTGDASSPAPPGVPRKWLLAAFAVSGAVGMSLQIAWVRSLTLVIGSSTYAFSSILVTFLLGIALGSVAFTRVRRATPEAFALLQGGIALAAFLLIPFFDRLPGLFLFLFQGFTGDYRYVLGIQFLVVGVVVLVPATLMGMTFPCLTGILVREREALGRQVGGFYAINTAGAIAGSALTGFFLIPFLGAQKTIALAILLNLAVAGGVLLRSRPALGRIVLPAGALALLVTVFSPPWDPGVMNLGTSIYPATIIERRESEGQRIPRRDDALRFFREGVSSTIAVYSPKEDSLYLTVNGKTNAGTGDMDTQEKLALLPLMLHPGAKRIALIGLGSGVTAGVAGLFAGVESIEVVELEPAMREAAGYFARENHGILRDPRFRFRADDGRSFMETGAGEYDVIISEPSNPWIAGVANLFTVEYLEAVKKRLAPGGVLAMWFNGYAVSPADYKLVLRTFLRVFPEGTLWQASGSLDSILVARNQGAPPLTLAGLEARAGNSPGLAGAFASRGTGVVDALLTSFVMGADDLRRFVGPGPFNTDDLNLLEFSAPFSLYRRDWDQILPLLLAAKTAPVPAFLGDPLLTSPVARLFLGEKMASQGNYLLASWEFTNIPTLAPRAPARVEPLRPGTGPAVIGRDGEGEGFLLPQAGLSRPDDDSADIRAKRRWKAAVDHLSRVSGLVPGTGRGGGTGLRVRGNPEYPCGYFVPLAVEPGASYEVRFAMASRLSRPAEAGLQVSYFDTTRLDARQPPESFVLSHRVGFSTPVRVTGPQDWREHATVLRAPAGARAANLVFFVGESTPNNFVVFDDIRVRRLAGP